VNVDCQSCGSSLELPIGLGEGREFACSHCGLLLRNVEATREFRWADVDRFTRRHGTSRLRFWAGLFAGLAWLPAAAGALALRHRFVPAFVAALAVPWCAIVLWLARRRPSTPLARWYVLLWVGVGAFAIYVAMLVAIVPAWRPLLGIGEDPEALKLVFVIGVLAMMVGAAGASLYAWLLKRTPSARATPPSADPS
jgi:hypothetical protein